MVSGAPCPTRRSLHSHQLVSRWQQPIPPSVRRSNPSLTTTCSSAVYDIHHRHAGGAPDSRCSQPSGWRLARVPAHRCQRQCIRFHSLLVHRIGAQEWCYSTHSATCAAPATHGPLSATARMQRLFYCAGSHTLLPPPATAASTRACSPFLFFRVPTLFLAGRFRARTRTRSSVWLAAFVHAHARARPHAHTRTNDRRRKTRRAVRRRG